MISVKFRYLLLISLFAVLPQVLVDDLHGSFHDFFLDNSTPLIRL